jgi:hypothetical protein
MKCVWFLDGVEWGGNEGPDQHRALSVEIARRESCVGLHMP